MLLSKHGEQGFGMHASHKLLIHIENQSHNINVKFVYFKGSYKNLALVSINTSAPNH